MFLAVNEEDMLGDETWIEVEVVDPLFDQMGIEVDKSLVISEEIIPKDNCIFFWQDLTIKKLQAKCLRIENTFW